MTDTLAQSQAAAGEEKRVAAVEVRPPKKRIMELDLARSIAILGLPLVHMMEEFSSSGFLSNPEMMESTPTTNGYELFLRFLTSSFAPMFMILMGVNITLSSHSTARNLFKRGLRIILYFFILNILRFVLPDIFAYLGGYGNGLHEALTDFIASDILFLAGSSMVLIALSKKLNITPIMVLVIALAMMALNMLVPEDLLQKGTLGTFMGNFIWFNENCYFPLASWFAYPALGYAVGAYIKPLEQDIPKKNRLYRELFCLAAVLIADLYICMKVNGHSPGDMVNAQSTIYLNDFWCFLSAVLWTAIWFTAAWFIVKRIKSPWVKNAIYKISDSIMIFYAIQWILVGWLCGILLFAGKGKTYFMGDVPFYILSILVWVLTLGGALWINSRLRRKGIKL